MDLVTRLGRSAAAAALVLAGTAASAQEVGDLAHQIATRSAALSQVLDRLSVPETAQTLVNSAIAGDPRAFNRIFDGIELPVVNKCFWISELVEKLTTSGGFVEQCWLREDLSTAEWLRYTQIAVQYALTKGGQFTDVETDASGHTLIRPGAFLDELKANGLVTCVQVWKTTGSTSLVFQKPERFCIHTP